VAEERAVLYGSLYLDRGERMAKAKEQIDSFRKIDAVAFYFDVIYGPEQERLGTEYAKRVRCYAEKHLTCPVSVAASLAKTPHDDPRFPLKR
jgi:hypothetical protein